MSYARDLKYIMTNDGSLNSYCPSRIHFENLPDNFELIQSWIVYSFNKSLQQNCLDGKAFTQYNIVVKIIATDTIVLETISDRAVEYLNRNYYGGIQDIVFTGDNHAMDLEKKVYTNTLQFDSWYV
jgi:hypothetical protein